MWTLRPPHERPSAPVDAGPVAASLNGRAGLYVHVPFCTTICPFCPYNKVRFEASRVGPYFQALAREAALHAEAHPQPFGSLYVGGGTPTLCLDALAPVLEGLAVEGERAIEVLPSHAVPGVLDRLGAMGFTHASLGVQSYDDGVLRRLGRPHTGAHARRALDAVRGRFACIDVDLIFDTARADMRTFLDDVRTCFQAGVEQVSTYPLMRFGMTPFGKGPHDSRLEHEALDRAADLASRHGYVRDAVWTFRRGDAPSYSSITRPRYIGLGAGAATFTGRRFLVNHFSPHAYAKALARGHLPIARDLRLGVLHAAAFHLFWRLYTGRVEVRPVSGFPGARGGAALLRLGTLSGHLRPQGRTLALTSRGYAAYHDLERWVTYRFIEPLWEALTIEAREEEGRAMRYPGPSAASAPRGSPKAHVPSSFQAGRPRRPDRER